MSGVLVQALDFIGPKPAFHAGDRGSNPLGDAKMITKGYVEKRNLFVVLRLESGPPKGPIIR
jgi:hypothetical protein